MIFERYFDTFEHYDACFDAVWKEYPIGDKPKWQHYWFYRYLQISPSYIMWSKMMDLHEEGVDINSVCPKIPELPLVAQTFHSFDDVWELDFTRWWYLIGRNQFNVDLFSIGDVREIFAWPNQIEILDRDLIEAKEHVELIYNNLQSKNSYPSVVGLCIPIQSSIRKTLKSIERFLKANYPFAEESKVESNYQIYKSKIREHSVSDCFKTLEIRADQEKVDLVKVAKEGNTLKGAMADLKSAGYDASKMNSVESLRSGTSRQLSMAILLAENAARGRFPCLEPIEILAPDYIKIRETFRRLKKAEEFRNFDIKKITKEIDFIIKNPESADWHALKRIKA